jgi:hypothetical protein
VRAYTDPQKDADYGNYGVSTSVYLKMKVGDVVTIDCSGTIPNFYTSFSGHLERHV